MGQHPEPAAQPWPYWMLRFIAANGDEQAYTDLVWSVGASPPYGGVDGDEADAVFALLEAYVGPGVAGSDCYERVAGFVAGRPDAVLALEAFRIHDRIASDPEGFGSADVAAGRALATQSGHGGLAIYFELLAAEIALRDNHVRVAKDVLLGTLPRLTALAAADRAYVGQARVAAQNAAAVAAMDGDSDRARIAGAVMEVLAADPALAARYATDLTRPPGFVPAPPAPRFDDLAREGSDLLHAGDLAGAIDRFIRAEEVAGPAGREAGLCEVLGEKAVALDRAGDQRGAIDAYDRAIELCLRYGEMLSLSRWTANLVGLLVARGDLDDAEPILGTMLDAAARTGRPDRLAIAETHTAAYLAARHRFQEAADRLVQAGQYASDDPYLADAVRRDTLVTHLAWAEALWQADDRATAAGPLRTVVRLADATNADEVRLSVRAHLLLAQLHDRAEPVPLEPGPEPAVAEEPTVPAHERDEVAALLAMRRDDLDGVLGAWAAGAAEGTPPAEAATPFLAWLDGIQDRLARGRANPAPATSAGGAAGLLHLGEQVAEGQREYEAARETTAALGLDPDVATAVCLHVAQGDGVVAGTVIQLVADTTPDDVFAARLYRLLLAFVESADGDQRFLDLIEVGLARLANGADEALRAELLNEGAAHLARLGRQEESLRYAREAREVAGDEGYGRLAQVAAGNEGAALMALDRAAEAIAALDPAADEAVAPPDEAGHPPDVAPHAPHLPADEAGNAPDLLPSPRPHAPHLPTDEAGHPPDVAADLPAEEAGHAPDLPPDGGAEAHDSHGAHDAPEPGEDGNAIAAGDEAAEAHGAAPDTELERLERAWLETAEPATGVALAREYTAAGRPAAALAVLNAARGRIEAGGDGELRVEFLTVDGLAHGAANDTSAMLASLGRAHELALAADPSPAGVAATREWGAALTATGRAAEAVEVLEACLPRVRALDGDPTAEAAIGLALARALAASGDTSGADRALERAGETFRAAGDLSGLSRTMAFRGDVALTLDDLGAARRHLATAAGLAEQAGDRHARAAALAALGTVHMRAGEPAEAAACHERAAGEYHALGAAEQERSARLDLVECHLRRGDAAAAEEAFQPVLAPDAPVVVSLASRTYFLTALLRAERGDWAGARPALRQCLDSVSRERVSAPPGERWRRARAGDHAYELAGAAAVRAGDATFAAEVAEGRRAAFLRAAFGDALPAAALPTLEEVTAALPPHTVAAYVDLAPALTAVCAGRGGWSAIVRRPGVGPEDVPAASGSAIPAGRLDAVGRLLGRELWAPLLEVAPEGTTGVVLLPSPRLAGLPLDAARLPEGGQVGERLRVGYAPSLTLLHRDEDAPAPPRALGQAVDITGDRPFSRRAAGTAAAPATTFTGPEATVDAVLKLLRGSDVVHFAGPGRFDPDDPPRSHLRCATSEGESGTAAEGASDTSGGNGGGGDAGDSGRLTVARLLSGDGPVGASLVLLSACDSGTAAAGRWHGAAGLPGTLLVAGARQVIATHWSVGDLEAALIAGEFFRRWRDGAVPASTALAAAQRCFRSEMSNRDVVRTLHEWDAPAAVLADWAGRPPDAPAFAGSVDWAAFHLVGAP